MTNRWLCVVFTVLALGCTTAPPARTPSAPSAEMPAALPAALPAWETAAERASGGLFDQYDDFRIAKPQWYARTVPPPAGTFVAMAEWQPMSAVWTTYSASIPGNPAVRRMYAEQTLAFAKVGAVKVIVPSDKERLDLQNALLDAGMAASDMAKTVEFVTLPSNAIWHIDYGPLPIVDKQDGHVSFVDFVYYKKRTLDDAIPTRLAQDYYQHVTTYRMPMNFEGGNFQADGLGTCATSWRALKNTGFSEAKVRNIFKDYLGCNDVVIMQDITDDGTGHIDMFFKWLGPDAVMIGAYEPTITVDYDGDGALDQVTNPDAIAEELAADGTSTSKSVWWLNKQRMDDNAALWASKLAPTGKPYTVHRLPMMTRFRTQSGDLPRTFINSTFFNGVNVYPTYTTQSCHAPQGKVCKQETDCDGLEHCAAGRCTPGPVAQGCDEILTCPNDQTCAADPLKSALHEQVLKQWQAALPGYQHVGVRADQIALWSGAVHCITRTIPAQPLQKSVPDGLCVQGQCGCVPGGASQPCYDNDQCFGPTWLCNCNICKGICPNGQICSDDADCGVPVETGACKIEAAQGCYGQPPVSPGDGPAGNQVAQCPQDAVDGGDTAQAPDTTGTIDASSAASNDASSTFDVGAPDSGSADIATVAKSASAKVDSGCGASPVGGWTSWWIGGCAVGWLWLWRRRQHA